MAGNKVVLEFAGDATKLARENQKAQKGIEDFGKAAKNSGNDLNSAAKDNENYVSKIGKLGAAVDGASTAINDAGAAVQAFADIQDAGREKIQRHERALVDVKQAQEDYAQALRDGKQAAIDTDQAEVDLEQARLDQKTTLDDYNKAVKEHGKNSKEAAQAQLDMKQAGVDVKQALEDQQQALRDASQATIDAKSAQLDLNDAQKEANPPDAQKWADDLNMYLPVLQGLVGVIGIVTAVQWAWNAAQAASPTTWIILAIVALIAVIVLIATKTDWFQRAWKNSWNWIKDAAGGVGRWFRDTLWGSWIKGTFDSIVNKGVQLVLWFRKLPDSLKSALSGIANSISAPFRSAFNFISTAWNNTIGRLSWSIPGWVPGIGGNSISVPNLPHFHTGGKVPGSPSTEMLAVLRGGETVNPGHSNNSGDMLHVTITLDNSVIGEATTKYVRGRGGNVQIALGGRNA